MFYSVHQRDFGVKVWFEARCDSEARVRALFLMTALRGEQCWGKKLHLASMPAHEVQSPFFAGGFFQELDPLLPRLRSYLRAYADHREARETAEHLTALPHTGAGGQQ